MRKRHLFFFVLWISLSVVSFCDLAWAETSTHTVVKGDTLESICIQYYGNRNLLPELWKKNPAVIDPTKLNPGEVIVLLEDVPIKPISTVSASGVQFLIGAEDAAWSTRGVSVSDYCDVDAMGFLSPERVKPWGVIASDETERIFLGQYDNVYVTFEKGRKVKIGDIFNVYRESDCLGNPIGLGSVGYTVLYLGRLVLTEKVGENSFKAEISASYRVMRVGDRVLPYKPVSSCIQPSNPDWKKCGDADKCVASIVASRDQQELIGQYSVVYINRGYKQGIERGNLFAIVTRMETSGASGDDLPDLVLGYLMILDARLETSTAVVLNARKDFPNGTTIKAVDLNRVFKKALAAQGYDDIKEIDIRNELVPVLIKLKDRIDLKKDLPESLYLLSNMVKCSVK
ncbi:MAG: LysM peptidoglycan-binding domain-containing protein [Deltaproteobacteria bacterium]|nr:LysM peptidoglycan-binding domain-containing protein [Deltaproteobacteria bacterium]